jgi:hypothetical protein
MPGHEWPPDELYSAYQAARAEVQDALAYWRSLPPELKRGGFAVYRAAADREDAAALTWMRACAAYDAAVADAAASGPSPPSSQRRAKRSSRAIT